MHCDQYKWNLPEKFVSSSRGKIHVGTNRGSCCEAFSHYSDCYAAYITLRRVFMAQFRIKRTFVSIFAPYVRFFYMEAKKKKNKRKIAVRAFHWECKISAKNDEESLLLLFLFFFSRPYTHLFISFLQLFFKYEIFDSQNVGYWCMNIDILYVHELKNLHHHFPAIDKRAGLQKSCVAFSLTNVPSLVLVYTLYNVSTATTAELFN